MADDDGAPRQPVQLLVYDLTRGMARTMSMGIIGVQVDGIWHSGVLVYGTEYYFGGGIQTAQPGQFARETGLAPAQTLDMGHTEVPEELFLEFLSELAPRFTAATYNLLSNNCNHMAHELVQFLTGQGVPDHVLGQPERLLATPIGQQLRPMIEMAQGQMQMAEGQALPMVPGLSGASPAAVRAAVQTQAAPAAAPAAAPVVDPGPEWACAACTMLNSGSARACCMCETPRPAAEPAPAPAPAPEPEPQPQPEPEPEPQLHFVLSKAANMVSALRGKVLEAAPAAGALLATLEAGPDADADAAAPGGEGEVEAGARALLAACNSAADGARFPLLCAARLIPLRAALADALADELRAVVDRATAATAAPELLMGLALAQNCFASPAGRERVVAALPALRERAAALAQGDSPDIRRMAMGLAVNLALSPGAEAGVSVDAMLPLLMALGGSNSGSGSGSGSGSSGEGAGEDDEMFGMRLTAMVAMLRRCPELVGFASEMGLQERLAGASQSSAGELLGLLQA